MGRLGQAASAADADIGKAAAATVPASMEVTSTCRRRKSVIENSAETHRTRRCLILQAHYARTCFRTSPKFKAETPQTVDPPQPIYNDCCAHQAHPSPSPLP